MKKLRNAFVLLGSLALASTVLTGCSNSSTTTTTTPQTTTSYAQYLFNVNNGGPSVASFVQHIDSGALTPTATPIVAAGTNPQSFNITPAGQFAYVNNTGANTISQYYVNPSYGTLTAITTDMPSGGTGTPIGGAVHPSGAYYYTCNAGDISVFTIGSTGALTLVSNTAATTLGEPQQITFDSTGAYAYVTGATGLYSFAVTPGTGALVAGPTYSTTAPLGGIVVDNASHLYATAGTQQIMGWSIGGSGILTPINGLPTLPTGAFNGTPAGLTFEPNHAAIYVAEPGTSSIGAFSVGGGGLLGGLIGQPYTSGTDVYAVAADPTGSYLYSANFAQNAIGAYTIGSGGVLGLVLGQPFQTGAGPNVLKLIQYVSYVTL